MGNKARSPIPYEAVATIVSSWPRLTGYVPAIAERFGVPRATAYRWVAQARLRGYLPAATKTGPCPRCGGTGGVTATFGRKGAGIGPDTAAPTPKGNPPTTKEEAVDAATDEGKHNYGEEVDVAAVVEASEDQSAASDRATSTRSPVQPRVEISPGIRFGRPAIKGISTEAIAGMVWAGENIGTVADDYGISRHEVLLACWHEGMYGSRAYRQRWKAWAEDIQPRLGGWKPFDPDTEPGPPCLES